MNKHSFLILSIFLIALSSAANAGKLYKWVDENGKISFSDKVPPKDSRREREELNEMGRTIAVRDAAKTPEQIKQFKKIQALKVTQEKLLNDQLTEDAALLKTFQTEADIDALATSKLEMINSHIVISSGQSETLKKQLILHQKSAANFERSGKKIPKKTTANIASAQGQFDKNQREIANFESQKEDLATQLARDKARFSVLSSQSKEAPSIHNETVASLFLGEIPCSPDTCQQLWKKAQQFMVDNNSTIIFTSANLVLTKTPKLSKDRGLSLTKATAKTGSVMTLDIRCADSKAGKATCKNDQTKQLVEQFNQLGN